MGKNRMEDKMTWKSFVIIFFALIALYLYGVFEHRRLKENGEICLGFVYEKIDGKSGGWDYLYRYEVEGVNYDSYTNIAFYDRINIQLNVGSYYLVVYDPLRPSRNVLLRLRRVDKDTNIDSLKEVVLVSEEKFGWTD